MAISALATEAKAVALIAEARRCLAIGVGMTGQYLLDLIDQLESATVNDLSGRTNISPNSKVDGRNSTDAATAGG